MKSRIYFWLKKYRSHIWVWALFILYETVVIGLISGIFGHPLTYLVHYGLSIALFYVHADLILPWALSSKINAIWRLPVLIVAEIWIYILVCYLLDDVLVHAQIIHYGVAFKLTIMYQLKMLYRGLLFMGFGTGYFFLKRFNDEREKSNHLEKQRLTEIINRQKFEQQLAKAENDFLKAQINPHFLFNTLDFIYHTVVRESPLAADTIIALSEMMHFAIDAEKTHGFIALGDEIEQVENLIYLTQLRKKDQLNFDFYASEAVKHLYLIPLVLLTITENIFKHGDLTDPQNPAKMMIDIINGHLVIRTSNGVCDILKKGGGSGLANISQRLKNAYDDKADLKYWVSAEHQFETYITIPIEILTGPSSFSGI